MMPAAGFSAPGSCHFYVFHVSLSRSVPVFYNSTGFSQNLFFMEKDSDKMIAYRMRGRRE
jgi:hypothetical protein